MEDFDPIGLIIFLFIVVACLLKAISWTYAKYIDWRFRKHVKVYSMVSFKKNEIVETPDRLRYRVVASYGKYIWITQED